jgi:hypothetical protein
MKTQFARISGPTWIICTTAMMFLNGKKHGFNPVTVQPGWTTSHHNPTEQ